MDLSLRPEMGGVRLGLLIRQHLADPGIVLLSSSPTTSALRLIPDRELRGWSYLLLPGGWCGTWARRPDGDGTVTFVPTAGFVGTAVIPYYIRDGRGGTASARVLVTVLPPRGRVDVTVQMVSGTPLSGVPVDVVDQAGSVIGIGATETSGRHSFLDLPAGTMVVRANTTQAGVISAQVTVVLGQIAADGSFAVDSVPIGPYVSDSFGLSCPTRAGWPASRFR